MNKHLDEYRFDLIDFIKNKYDLNGSVQSVISCLDFYFSSVPSEFSTSVMYEPSLCIILQGSKAVGFGDKMYGYNHKEYLLSSAHVPANVKITQASQIEPYMSLRIRFKIEDIYEVLKNTNPDKLLFQKKSEKGLFFDDLSVRLYEPISRLIKLLDKPNEDINYLSPFIIKEILYILVNGKSGYFLNKFAMEGTTSNKIVKAISEIKNNFSEKLNIKELADLIQMSESSLYQNFKSVILSVMGNIFLNSLAVSFSNKVATNTFVPMITFILLFILISFCSISFAITIVKPCINRNNHKIIEYLIFMFYSKIY